MKNTKLIASIIEKYYYSSDTYYKECIENIKSLYDIPRDELIQMIINDKYLLRYIFSRGKLDIFSNEELENFKKLGLYKMFSLDTIDDFTREYNILEEDNEIIREFKYVKTELLNNGLYSWYINPEILKNEKMCLELIKVSKLILNYIDESLMHDVSFLTTLINEYKLIRSIPKKYWDDTNFQMAVLKVDDNYFSECNDEIRNNRDIVFSIVEKKPNLYKYVGSLLRNDKELILKNLKNKYYLLEYVGDELKNDKEFFRSLITENYNVLRYIGDELKNDKEFFRSLITENCDVFKYASDNLKKDEEFILSLISENSAIIKYVNSKLLRNVDFLAKAYNISSDIIEFIPKGDYEIRTILNNLKVMTKEEKIAHIIDVQKRYNSNLLEKLVERYYSQYKNKIVTKNPEKDNYYDFFKVMVTSNILEMIYKSNEYSINDTRFVEHFIDDNSILIEYNKVFDIHTRNILKEKIQHYKNKYRCFYLSFYKTLLEKLSKKQDISELCLEYELDAESIEIEIISNKYFDSKMKDSAINLLNDYNDKTINLLDIVVLLERMADNKSTISQALNDNNIDSKTFYTIYNYAKDNNPALYQYIKESLNYNKIRGFKKLIYLANRVIKSNFTTIEEFYEICNCKLDIEVVLSALKNTELYVPLYNKVKNIFNLNSDEESKTKI